MNRYLNTEVEQYIEKMVGEQHQYQTPYATDTTCVWSSQKTLGTYAEVLRRRLHLDTPKPVEARATMRRSEESKIKGEENNTAEWWRAATGQEQLKTSLKQAVQSGGMQPTVITAPSTEPSTLTNSWATSQRKNEESEKQGQQLDNLLSRIMHMMEMMQQMFSLMTNILMRILPDRTPPHDTLTLDPQKHTLFLAETPSSLFSATPPQY